MRRRRTGPARPVWNPLGLHRPGTGPLHRAPTGAKLAALLVLGLVLVLHSGLVLPVVALGVVAAAAASARLPLRRTVHGLLPVLVTAALVGGYQWWARGWQVGAEVATELVTLVLAASVVTATTRADALLDLVARLARPLRHVGLRPEVVALALGLMLRAVPVLLASSSEARDAARARGLERSPRAVLVPAAVRMVGHGYRTGEALAARGIVD
ncbi:energy-coupling factor transporter transmembrane component T [Actinotalea sp. AC32]|nr:energy-coupling factor transporter transmembrane component T [Actinotalea sp. AC32]